MEEGTKKELYKTLVALNKTSARIHIGGNNGSSSGIDRELDARISTGSGTTYEIRALAYTHGVPMRLRGVVWKLLLGYVPLDPAERDAVLNAKRREYFSLIQGLDMDHSDALPPAQKAIMKDIEADLPRTFVNGFEEVCSQQAIQGLIKRPLYVWSSRNAMGYYQGMMDLVYAIFFAFVAEHESICGDVDALRRLHLESIDGNYLLNLEADIYHCFGLLIRSYEVKKKKSTHNTHTQRHTEAHTQAFSRKN